MSELNSVNVMNYSDDFLNLRHAFYEKYDTWRTNKLIKPVRWASAHHLAELLGYSDIDHLLDYGNKDEVIHTLKLLNGPNGLTVYRMLMIRRGFR